MASALTRALDALFHAAGDVRAAAADMRPITPAELQQQRDLLALAARIRTDVARIGNTRAEGNSSGPAKVGISRLSLPFHDEAARVARAATPHRGELRHRLAPVTASLSRVDAVTAFLLQARPPPA